MPQKTKLSKNYFEKEAWNKELFACGIDEVGRGCLAGPLVVGAVVIPKNTNYQLLKDSKILTEEERERAFLWICRNCIWSIASTSHYIIDKKNIYQATKIAMKKAYQQIIEILPFPFKQLKYVLIDAVPLKPENSYKHDELELYNFNFGEKFSSSIAAASIVAKVMRDRLMKKMSPIFPAFSLHQNKGYGTKQHIEALLQEKESIIHRKSFVKSIYMNNQKNSSQQLLF